MTTPRKGTPTAVLNEKRVEPSANATLSATVVAGKRRVAFTIDNLSVTGARLIGPLPLTLGETIVVVLDIDSRSLELAAEVVRVHTADLISDQVDVRFADVPSDAAAAIRALIGCRLESLEVDEERVTSRLPKSEITDIDPATLRFAKHKKR